MADDRSRGAYGRRIRAVASISTFISGRSNPLTT
jgi:hypothetical protein